MKRLKSFCVWMIVGMLLSSCSHFSDISVGDIESFSVNGFEGNAVVFTLSLPIDNPTGYKITISDLDAKVYMNGSYLGKVKLSKPLVVEKRVRKSYDLVLKVRIANILGSAFAMMNMGQGQLAHFHVKGYFTARSMLLRKKIKIDEQRTESL